MKFRMSTCGTGVAPMRITSAADAAVEKEPNERRAAAATIKTRDLIMAEFLQDDDTGSREEPCGFS